MTSNVELVRGICAAWERGDFSSAEWADPEIEFAIVDGPEPAHLTGLAAMANRWRDQLRAWSDVRPRVDEYRTIDHQRVLVLHRLAGRGKASGLEFGQLESRGAALFHIQEGKVVRLVLSWDRDRMLADLGLRPFAGDA